MNTFRNKYFKNELDPKYALYDFLTRCEFQNTYENTFEECIEYCASISLKKNLDG